MTITDIKIKPCFLPQNCAITSDISWNRSFCLWLLLRATRVILYNAYLMWWNYLLFPYMEHNIVPLFTFPCSLSLLTAVCSKFSSLLTCPCSRATIHYSLSYSMLLLPCPLFHDSLISYSHPCLNVDWFPDDCPPHLKWQVKIWVLKGLQLVAFRATYAVQPQEYLRVLCCIVFYIYSYAGS